MPKRSKKSSKRRTKKGSRSSKKQGAQSPPRKKSIVLTHSAEDSFELDLHKTVPTYVYLGHGHELTHIPDKTIIPGCTLSTITDFSLSAHVEHLFLLCHLAEINQPMVTQPVKYYRELYDLYKGTQYNNNFVHKGLLIDGEFHLKEEGDNYHNKFCSFLLEFYNKKGKNIVSVFRSGLYDITTPGLQLPRLDGDNIFDKSSIDVDIRVGLTVANIKDLYSGCVYPNIEDILSNVKINFNQRAPPDLKIDELNDTHVIPFKIFEYALHDTVKMDVSQLMERFPGNHYYFLCRGASDEIEMKQPYENVIAHRELSKNRAEARLGKPIVTPYHGVNIRAQQHFQRQIQKVFIELYKSDNGKRENKGEPYPNYEVDAREEVTKVFSEMLEILIEYFEEFIDSEGQPSPYILKFCNAIINRINQMDTDTVIAFINRKLLRLMRETQQYESAVRLNKDLYE